MAQGTTARSSTARQRRSRGSGSSPTALGWRAHSGWAVAVVLSGARAPEVLWRERVELLSGVLPRQPYHAVADLGLTGKEAARLIDRVERTATRRAAAATARLVEAHRVSTVGVVGGGRVIPEDIERVLASHAYLHAAEGALYEEVLAEAATGSGFPPLLVPPRTIEIPPALDRAGKTLGPPWQKDHKLAATVALLALGSARR